jgi:hypothetical protein
MDYIDVEWTPVDAGVGRQEHCRTRDRATVQERYTEKQRIVEVLLEFAYDVVDGEVRVRDPDILTAAIGLCVDSMKSFVTEIKAINHRGKPQPGRC